VNGRAAEAQRGAAVNAREQFAPAAAHLDAARRCAEGAKVAPMVGAIQSDALTLRIFVIRLVGSDLRASRFCRTWPNRPPNRRFYG